MPTTGKLPLAGDLHVLMFPFVAFGHISPFLQLSGKLSSAGVRVTFLSTPANLERISSLLPFSPSLSIISLPLPTVPGLPSGIESTGNIPPDMTELLKLAVDRMQPSVADLVADLRPDIIFFDFAQPWIPSIANPLGIKTVFFSVFSAAATAYLTVPARGRSSLAADATKSYEGDLTSPPADFPASTALAAGVPAYQAEDFTYIYQSLADGAPSVYDRVLAGLTGCSAVAAKTCMEMEGPYIRYVESQLGKPLLLAGPVVPEPPAGELGSEWAEFLDRFDDGAVVFCSFGSESYLLQEGVSELLSGLELAGLPYLVVLKGGIGAASAGGNAQDSTGLIREGWAPQQLILRHRSVGCFLCHAGLSSVVEGVVTGCRTVLLPQKGDQFLNARLFAEDLGVAVEVERDEDGGFDREAVREAVECVMSSPAVEEKAEKLRGFLKDDVAHGKFMEEFVGKLKELVQ